MSRGGRIGLVVAAVAVAVVLFLVARPGDDDDDSDGERAGTTTEQPAQTGPGSPDEPPPPPEPDPPVRITVRGGEPVGGVREIEVDSGDRLRLVVTADAPEHVHVHGYDLIQDVGPGMPARFNFEADNEGGFEIELENSATQIADLTVTP